MAVVEPREAFGEPIIERRIDTSPRLDNQRIQATQKLNLFLEREEVEAMQKEMLRRMEGQIKAKIAQDLPACYGCDQVDMRVDSMREQTDMDQRITMTAICRAGSGRAGEPLPCPKRVSHEIDQAYMPFPPREYAHAKVQEEVLSNPDRPQTAADAW